jgi:hypothetical protein
MGPAPFNPSARAFAVGMPIVIACAIFRRPRVEHPTIIALALTFAVSLNRDLLPTSAWGLPLVIAGSAFVITSGYMVRTHSTGPGIKSILLSVVVVVAVMVAALWWHPI